METDLGYNTSDSDGVSTPVYQQNKCSSTAKPIIVINESIQTHFWVEKHYEDRLNGDGDDKREGIDLDKVQNLVEKSFAHCNHYCFKHKNFIFVNYPPDAGRRLRIVLRQKFDGNPTLNVVVEYHFVELNKYEVTVITAMCKDEFDISNGQYAIEFTGKYSVLYQNIGSSKANNMIEVDTIV